MQQPPKGILFDLDGTLLDTAPDLGHALNHVLNQYGLPNLSYAQYRNYASHGVMGMLNCGFGQRLGEFDLASLKQQFLDYYFANICVDTRLFDGIEQLIAAMHKQQIPWGIVTNKPGWLTDKLLPYFSAFTSCKVVVSGDTLAKRKPHPEPLLFAADKMNISAAHIWYLGDAERDIQSARAANMVAVIAAYGYISAEENPQHWQADLSCNSVLELLPHLLLPV